MKVEIIARCNGCKKAHKIVSRQPDKQQSVNFICRCGTKIGGTYDTNSWTFSNAELSERNGEEAVFMHEPEIS